MRPAAYRGRADALIGARLREAVRVDNDEGIGNVPDNRNVDYLGFVVHMKPRDFLALNPARSIDRQVDSIDHLRSHVAAGHPIASPFLSPSWDEARGEWRVIQHEGRGRMLVAHEEDPEQEIPVHVFPRGGMRARHLDRTHLFARIAPDRRAGMEGVGYRPRRVTHMGKTLHRDEPARQPAV